MSKHGKIAEGKTRLSALVSDEEKAALKAMAKKEGRSLSNFVKLELQKLVSGNHAVTQHAEADSATRGRLAEVEGDRAAKRRVQKNARA